MDKKKILGALGIVATVIGFGATMLSDFVKEKQLDDTIEEKVDEALARRLEEDDETEEDEEDEDYVDDVEEL